MTNDQSLALLIRDANKTAKTHKCTVKLVDGVVIASGPKNLAFILAGFDVRVEDIRDPAGKHMMSVKKAGDNELSRVYATADGRILFGILRS